MIRYVLPCVSQSGSVPAIRAMGLRLTGSRASDMDISLYFFFIQYMPFVHLNYLSNLSYSLLLYRGPLLPAILDLISQVLLDYCGGGIYGFIGFIDATSSDGV